MTAVKKNGNPEWKQSSNPMTDTGVQGYETVSVNYTANF